MCFMPSFLIRSYTCQNKIFLDIFKTYYIIMLVNFCTNYVIYLITMKTCIMLFPYHKAGKRNSLNSSPPMRARWSKFQSDSFLGINKCKNKYSQNIHLIVDLLVAKSCFANHIHGIPRNINTKLN